MYYEKLEKFSTLGKIYMLGDTNARLGSILSDMDINGTPISNRNTPLLLEFLDYTGLKIVNKSFALGVPAYEILQRKRSIIDMCLTNDMMNVRKFKVLPTVFGVSAQTFHKLIELNLSINSKQSISSVAITKIKRFKHCSFSNLIKVRDCVLSKLEDIRDIKQQCGINFLPNYNVIRKLYANAKKDILGFLKRKTSAKRVTSPSIRLLQDKIRQATAALHKERTDQSIFRLQNLENFMTKEYYKVRNRQFERWLGKLNNLDYC